MLFSRKGTIWGNLSVPSYQFDFDKVSAAVLCARSHMKRVCVCVWGVHVCLFLFMLDLSSFFFYTHPGLNTIKL